MNDQTSKVVKPLIDELEIKNYLKSLSPSKTYWEEKAFTEGSHYASDRYEIHISALESRAIRFAEWIEINGWCYNSVSNDWSNPTIGNIGGFTTEDLYKLFTDFINETNGK